MVPEDEANIGASGKKDLNFFSSKQFSVLFFDVVELKVIINYCLPFGFFQYVLIRFRYVCLKKIGGRKEAQYSLLIFSGIVED